MPVLGRKGATIVATVVPVLFLSLVGNGANATQRLGESTMAPASRPATCGTREGAVTACAISTAGASYPAPSSVVAFTRSEPQGDAGPNRTGGSATDSAGLVGPAFMTTRTPLTLENVSGAAATGVAVQFHDRNNNQSLRRATWVCLAHDGKILVNERLVTVEHYGEVEIEGLNLAPGASTTISAVYYAGPSENVGCGGEYSSRQPVAGGAYSGVYRSDEKFPSADTNPSATALTKSAQGGWITPSLTFTFQSDSASPTIVVVPSA